MLQDDSQQPLQLHPFMWVVLAVVALLGVSRLLERTDAARQLLPNVQVTRYSDSEHAFPRLGIVLPLPNGWTYLSRQDESIADTLIFVNATDQSIIKLTPFQFVSWPPVERPILREEFEHVAVDWIVADHRRVGRIKQSGVHLVLTVVSHRHGSSISDPIATFCDAIRLQDE